MARLSLRRGTYIHQSCHTCCLLITHTLTIHVPHINESWHIYPTHRRVMAHRPMSRSIRTCGAARAQNNGDISQHTHKRVMARISRHHGTKYPPVMTHTYSPVMAHTLTESHRVMERISMHYGTHIHESWRAYE